MYRRISVDPQFISNESWEERLRGRAPVLEESSHATVSEVLSSLEYNACQFSKIRRVPRAASLSVLRLRLLGIFVAITRASDRRCAGFSRVGSSCEDKV